MESVCAVLFVNVDNEIKPDGAHDDVCVDLDGEQYMPDAPVQ